MMTLNHSVMGAAVGRFLFNPFIAFIVGIVIHVITDKLPHYWPKTYKGQRIVQAIEWLTAPIFFILLYFFGKGDFTLMIAGALGGSIVDLVIVCIPPVNKGKLGKWHHERQAHSTNPKYLLVDVALIALFGFWVFFI